MSTPTLEKTPRAKVRPAEIVREYGPFGGSGSVGGVTHDGRHVWAAAGTAFDGTHLYQIAEARID
ncbi:MAG: hypothetical protein EOO24_30560, partial [Comamonadaceae bacterium]